MCAKKDDAKSKIDSVIQSIDRLSQMIERLLAAQHAVLNRKAGEASPGS